MSVRQEMSPHYAKWFIGAHAAYTSKDPTPLAGVTGQRGSLIASVGVHPTSSLSEHLAPGTKAFAYRLIGTWYAAKNALPQASKCAATSVLP